MVTFCDHLSGLVRGIQRSRSVRGSREQVAGRRRRCFAANCNFAPATNYLLDTHHEKLRNYRLDFDLSFFWRNALKKWMVLSANLLGGTACFAGSMGGTESDLMRDGLFLGLGTNYNSINVTQNSWGQGISNIITTTANTTGIAQGTGAPFHNTSNTFAPEIQAGYFKHFTDTQNLYGLKFSYQYLGSNATNSNLYIPQLGTTTSNITGVTSSLFGYVNADSVQVTTNHEFNLMAYLGRSFGNKYIYLGVGPSLFNMQSKNYYSIGYAYFEGATVDVTGLVSYSSPSIWAWGGAAQLGMTYFLSPTWFMDLSYTYAVTGNNTSPHEQAFTNTSQIGTTVYTTSGTLFTRDTLSISTQALTLTINKVFDL